MIRKSIFLAAILLLCYEAILRNINISFDTSQNDKSANIISVQNFLFNYSNERLQKDTVIIGTSVSRKIVVDSVGKDIINLAFNAWSTYDGLELVKLSRKKPGCLLIETNYAKNQILEPELTDNLAPLTYGSGKLLESVRLRNQPVGLLTGWGKKIMKERIEKLKEEKRANNTLYEFNLGLNISKMNEAIPDSVLKTRFQVLKTLIDGFKNENIGIVFFEVPVNEKLQETTSMKQVRKYFNDYFPEDKYVYIPLPSENNYVYSDGVHLTSKSAIDYSIYLRDQLIDLRK